MKILPSIETLDAVADALPDDCDALLRFLGIDRDPDTGTCFYGSLIAGLRLHRLGFETIPQAGSMMWPCADHDDGVNDTHFSYLWDAENPRTLAAIRARMLPEMHVWLGARDEKGRGWILDFATHEFPRCCESMGVMRWTAPVPPRYLFAHEALPGVHYEASASAICYVLAGYDDLRGYGCVQFLRDRFAHHPLKGVTPCPDSTETHSTMPATTLA